MKYKERYNLCKFEQSKIKSSTEFVYIDKIKRLTMLSFTLYTVTDIFSFYDSYFLYTFCKNQKL